MLRDPFSIATLTREIRKSKNFTDFSHQKLINDMFNKNLMWDLMYPATKISHKWFYLDMCTNKRTKMVQR